MINVTYHLLYRLQIGRKAFVSFANAPAMQRYFAPIGNRGGASIARIICQYPFVCWLAETIDRITSKPRVCISIYTRKYMGSIGESGM